MLERLVVKNLAVIEDIDVFFHSGFNALTGQTGAGKSLLIDSIYLLLGARADADLIRHGKDEANIYGLFKGVNKEVNTFLNELGIETKEDLTIYRKISSNNKNQIKVNEHNITLTDLKRLGLLLGDIHVQQDTYRLINKENYLSFLDDFNDKKFVSLYEDYIGKKMSYLDFLEKYNNTKKKNKELEQKLDLLLFQKGELEALNLEEDIDKKLQEEIDKLSNFDKIYSNINESYEALNNDYFNISILHEVANKLNSIKEYDPKYEELYQVVNDAYYNLDDVSSSLYDIKEGLDFDPMYLDNLNARLYEIDKIKNKYHMSVNELIKYLEDITLDIKLSTNYDETIKELKEELGVYYDKLFASALNLSKYRQKEAEKLEKRLVSICNSLDLENTKFKVIFKDIVKGDIENKNIFLEYGIDDIDFYVSFNIGEDLKPLAKVASGGELSRLMLAFKVIYLESHDLSFMVFDEIDSGISGITARKIGHQLKNISKNVQVFAITHLANVASLADHQYHIEKVIEDGRTKTRVKELDFDERVKEIALILGGIKLDSTLIQTAKKMILDE